MVDTVEQTHVTDLGVVTTDVGQDGKVVDVQTLLAVHAGALVEETLGLGEGDDLACHFFSVCVRERERARERGDESDDGRKAVKKIMIK